MSALETKSPGWRQEGAGMEQQGTAPATVRALGQELTQTHDRIWSASLPSGARVVVMHGPAGAGDEWDCTLSMVCGRVLAAGWGATLEQAEERCKERLRALLAAASQVAL
jgi:hypothetical protein